MSDLQLYTLSEQPNIGIIIITLSDDFVSDLNNDALRVQALAMLHRHANFVSQFLARNCILQYPSGIFTDGAGNEIEVPNTGLRIPLCTVLKEEDKSISMVMAQNILDDKNKAKLDSLHRYREAIGSKLTGGNMVLELQQYDARKKDNTQKDLLAFNDAKKKNNLELRKRGLIDILIGFPIFAIAGAATVLTVLFPVVGLAGIALLPGLISLLGLAFVWVGAKAILNSYGFTLDRIFEDREVVLDKNNKCTKHVATKSSPEVPDHVKIRVPDAIVKSSDIKESRASSKSTSSEDTMPSMDSRIAPKK